MINATLFWTLAIISGGTIFLLILIIACMWARVCRQACQIQDLAINYWDALKHTRKRCPKCGKFIGNKSHKCKGETK